MPLGLAKDSMLNLAELASKTDDEIITGGDLLKEDENSSSYSTIAKSEDDLENHRTNNENQIENNHDDSIAETAEKPMHLKITSHEVKEIENNSSSSINGSVGTEIQRQFEPTHQYAGFQADYHDFENYTFNSFPGDDVVSKHSGNFEKKNDRPWWQCIFPWLSSENDQNDTDDDRYGTEDLTQGEEENSLPQTSDSVNRNGGRFDNDDDGISMISAGSDIIGERLHQEGRQIIPERMEAGQSHERENQDDGDDIIIDKTPFRTKSILKRATRARDLPNVSIRSNGSISSQTQKSERRSLFPAYESKSIQKKNLNATFSPMARVVTIKSSKDMDDEEKSRIWWQKSDYDEFRKTGRIISKAMLQGGSEIWLATNQSWQLPNQGKAATLRRAMANVDNEDASEKWWHKFGHSRRGLEHVASIDEGRQRQANVKVSIRAILTEQRRQKAFHREDPEKLRICSIENTSWAKDLALASGASDADAVTKNFDDGNRKSREFYLLKFSRAGKLNSTSGTQRGAKQVVPAFMKPMMSMQLRPNRLDANITSRLQFQKKEKDNALSNYKRTNSDLIPKKAPGVGMTHSKVVARVPIHDPVANTSVKESLASKGKFHPFLSRYFDVESVIVISERN